MSRGCGGTTPLIPRLEHDIIIVCYGGEVSSCCSLFHSHSVPFPYLVLLCSGGHCLLAVAHSVTKFGLLGRSLDDSPGEALDKCARMMRLNLHPDLQGLSGGAAIEKLAKHGDRTKVQLMKKNSPIMHSRYDVHTCTCTCMINYMYDVLSYMYNVHV